MPADDGDDRVVVLPWEFCRQGWFASFWCWFLCGWVPFLFGCGEFVPPPSTTTQSPAPTVASTTSPTTASPAEGELLYYQSCGDPVCGGWREKEGIPICDDDGFKIGQPCDNKGFVCDPVNFCNSLITCTDVDPFSLGCPISYRHTKKDIHYLGREQLREVTDSLLSFQLATWYYTHEPAEAGADPHLGFIFEDVLGAHTDGVTTTSTTKDGGKGTTSSSPAIDEQRGMVDLYGYLSMAVAAIQTQQREIDDLRSEMELLKRGNLFSGGGREENETNHRVE